MKETYRSSPESPEQADSQSSEYRCELEKEPGEEIVNLGGESKRTHMNRLEKISESHSVEII